MGESFTPDLSSGSGTFAIPIAVAPGRASVQPSFALAYTSGAGNGSVGFGWGLSVPFIARQTDRGLPLYATATDGRWHIEEDRFVWNGGQELVPVASEAIARVDSQAGAGAGAIPVELAGWQQYRAHVEGAFARFFRSPDSMRWVVQMPDGMRFDLGALPTGQGPPELDAMRAASVESDPEDPTRVFRWYLARSSDRHGSAIHYAYTSDRGTSYLSDVYYISPTTCADASDAAPQPERTRACSARAADYGARVHFEYEDREDVYSSYVSGWRMEIARRLARIDVSAWGDALGARAIVRRYHLAYAAHRFHSLLESIQVEGRPSSRHAAWNVEIGDAGVPETSAAAGPRLPPMQFSYSAMPATSDAIAGFGGVSATVADVENSPPHSVDEERSDLFDVNSDGLVDLIVTDPATYVTSEGEPAVGVFWNGFAGSDARPAGRAAAFSGAVPVPVRADIAGVMSLANANVAPMDIDGDGRSDLLHMPRARSYGWFTPTREVDRPGALAEISPARQGWRWTYAEVDVPEGDIDPRVDFGRDRRHIQVLDVNNDHLIDIVRTTGTSLQTWLNLGWIPGGDGRFGSYAVRGPRGAERFDLSTEPIESCLVHAGTALDFEDPEVRFGDMNGDGLQDLVRLRRGRVVYWPGRGVGAWGDGPRTCTDLNRGARHVEMSDPPSEIGLELDGVSLADVDMDGASDIVQVRFDAVDVWFNRAGTGFTRRVIARGTPAAPAFALGRIRMVDVDGSGTTDIVYANARRWQYVDLAGGQRPRLLIGVENGYGASTTGVQIPFCMLDHAASARGFGLAS